MLKTKIITVPFMLRTSILFIMFTILIFQVSCTSYASQDELLLHDKLLSETLNYAKRKVIYTMDYVLITRQPDSIHAKVVAIAKKYNGYMVEQSINMTTIRVPVEYQVEIGSIIELLGRIDRKEVIGKDITEEYDDIKIKLETLEKARIRYLELLDKAEDVKATLEVERELERVNREIDLIKGKINGMTHRIEYVTITVRTKEEIRPGPLGWIFYGLAKGIGWLFVSK